MGLGLAGVVALGLAGLGSPPPAVEHVVVVGVTGLEWDDVDPAATPQLAELAEDGSVASLSVKAAPGVTCPSEGWLTLGAATYAAVVDPGEIDPAEGCAARPIPGPDALPGIDALNRDLRFGARVGWLAEHVGCVTAVGPGAALGAATADGRVGRSAVAELPEDPPEVLAACPVTLVDLGERAGTELDAALERVVEGLPPDAVLMVMGVGEIDARQAHLHTAIVTGPGFRGGYLRSASTRRLPYVQLVDVAPTIVQVLGDDAPDTAAGRPFVGDGDSDGDSDRPTTLAATIDALDDADERAVQQRRVLPKVWTALCTTFVTILLALTAAIARRRPAPRTLSSAAIGLSGVPAATFLANLVPWWRAERPALVLAFAVAAAAAALLAVTVALGRGRVGHQLVVVSLASVAVFFADGLTGAGLQIDSLLGYNALHAGRFVGFGNIAFAVLGAAAVLAAALLADGRRPHVARAVVAAVAIPVLALDGSPRWGADFGGVLTLVPTFVVLALLVAGAQVTWRRLAVAQGVGALAVGLIGWLDYQRPAADRSHFGRFVGDIVDGTAFATIERKALASWELLFIGPHTLAALVLTVGLVVAVFRPPPLLRQAYATHSVLRPLLQATVALALLGFATNDSGVAIPAVVALVTVPAALVLCATPGEPGARPRTSETA